MKRQQRWHGVANLVEALRFVAGKLEPIGKALQAGGFAREQPAALAVGQTHALHVACGTS